MEILEARSRIQVFGADFDELAEIAMEPEATEWRNKGKNGRSGLVCFVAARVL